MKAVKQVSFTMDFNAVNRKAIGRLLGLRRVASMQEVIDWVNDTVNDKIVDAIMLGAQHDQR